VIPLDELYAGVSVAVFIRKNDDSPSNSPKSSGKPMEIGKVFPPPVMFVGL
jgi:hypothetical protein